MKVFLNISKRDNFVFYDPENNMHLSLIAPFGYPTKVTNALIRALKAGNVIDVNNTTGVEISDKIKFHNDIILKKLEVKRDLKIAENNKEAEVAPVVETVEEVAVEEPVTAEPVTAGPVVEEPAVEESVVEEPVVEEEPKTKAKAKKNKAKAKNEEA